MECGRPSKGGGHVAGHAWVARASEPDSPQIRSASGARTARRGPAAESVSSKVARIVRRCLEKEPEARFQTALEMREHCRAALAQLESRSELPRSTRLAVGTEYP